jgi:antitoxin (DNA-binding transcriptional repressor) of toxin-antitoxin stability system
MDLHQVESVGVGRARRDLYEILRSVEGGSPYLLLRFDRPVAAVIPHADYLAFSELARKDALARALLQGKWPERVRSLHLADAATYDEAQAPSSLRSPISSA